MSEQLTVTLETVTPLFLGGAEPRDAPPELRAPSVRGALRYWLRAVAGVNTNLQHLKAVEATVFGDTSTSSSIAVRARTDAQPFDFFKRKMVSRPGGRPKLRLVYPEAEATRYLFFSLDETRDLKARHCFKPGETVEIELISRHSNVQAWRCACGALWLLTRLGGLGARARRGAGGLQFTGNVMPANWLEELPPLVVHAKTSTALVTDLGHDLKKLRQALGVEQATVTSELPSFDVLAPGLCRIWVLEPTSGVWQSWSSALSSVAQALAQARSETSHGQLRQVKAAAEHGARLPVINRAGLGLPIVFQDVQARETIGTLEGDQFERRSSPLHIRVIKLASNPMSYAVVLTWFEAVFAPIGSQLALKSGKEQLALGNLPDSSWVENEFWPAFDANSGARRTEVEYQ